VPDGEDALNAGYITVAVGGVQFSLLRDILSYSTWRTESLPADSDEKLSFHDLTRSIKSSSFKYGVVGLNLAMLSNECDLGVTPFNFNGDDVTITQWCNRIEDLRIHPSGYDAVMEKISVYF
jgi:hypothetical protein